MLASKYGMSKKVHELLDDCPWLIKKFYYVDASNDQGETALMFAAFAGEVEICKVLLEAGASVDKKCRYGNTALMYCALTLSSSSDESEEPGGIYKLLLEYGAYPVVRDKVGLSPLAMRSEICHYHYRSPVAAYLALSLY